MLLSEMCLIHVSLTSYDEFIYDDMPPLHTTEHPI